MTEDEYRAIVEQLDSEIPRVTDAVTVEPIAGSLRRSRIIGTSDGFRRLGTELLRGGLALIDRPGGQATVNVDLSYLIHPESAIQFSEFELRDVVDIAPAPVARGSATSLFVVMSTIAVVGILVVVGFFAILEWVVWG